MPSKTSEELKPILINTTNESQSKTSGKKGKTDLTRNVTFNDLISIMTIQVFNELKCSQCSHLNPTTNAKCEKCSSKIFTTSLGALWPKSMPEKSSETKPKPVVTPKRIASKPKLDESNLFVDHSFPKKPKPRVPKTKVKEVKSGDPFLASTPKPAKTPKISASKSKIKALPIAADSFLLTLEVKPTRIEWQISGIFPSNAYDTPKMRAVVLTVFTQTKVELVLHQKGVTGVTHEEREVLDLCLAVFSWNGYELGKLQKNSDRKLDDFVTCDLILEPGVYIVVNLAFNHFHKNIQNEEHYREYDLKIHSNKQLDVKQMSPPTFIIADSLIAITIALGDREEISDENGILFGTLYYLSNNWSGFSAVVENRDPNLFLNVIADLTGSKKVVSSRDILIVEDNIPPRHKQLIIHLTEWDPNSQSLTKMATKFIQVPNYDRREGEHWPLFDRSDIRLHSPRPL